jgi:hypothetical protein
LDTLPVDVVEDDSHNLLVEAGAPEIGTTVNGKRVVEVDAMGVNSSSGDKGDGAT